jgi:DNA-binding transcriptional MerR regulator
MQDLENKQKMRRKKSKINQYPEIPNKLYFSIGEAGKLCAVKPYVIRFWEQAFPMLKPAKLRCGRRYYCQKEILLIRTIRTLLYEQGFTIEGACLQLLGKDNKAGVFSVDGVVENVDVRTTTAHVVSSNNASNVIASESVASCVSGMLVASSSNDIAANIVVDNNEEEAKTKLLKEVVGRIGDIISLLEAKPEENPV